MGKYQLARKVNDQANLELVNHFFKVHGISTNQCHEPTETCDQQAIRAHSIPSSTVLSRLSHDGHVVMPYLKLKVPPPSIVSFKRVGKNNATTFSGLCAQHDNDLFQPIDDQLPDLNNKAHLFLLAYRAVLREYHAVLQNAIRFQSTYQKEIEVGLSSGNEPSNLGMIATANILNAYECYEYKRQFDHYYLSCDWSQLKHDILFLRNQTPSIAVSSLFSLDDIDVDAPKTPRVTLSVFPIRSDVAVILSAIPEDAPFVSAYLHPLLSSEAFLQKYLLSKIILGSCDNFVIAPQYYDSMSQERKEAIEQFYVDTISTEPWLAKPWAFGPEWARTKQANQKNAWNYEDKRLYLF